MTDNWNNVVPGGLERKINELSDKPLDGQWHQVKKTGWAHSGFKDSNFHATIKPNGELDHITDQRKDATQKHFNASDPLDRIRLNRRLAIE